MKKIILKFLILIPKILERIKIEHTKIQLVSLGKGNVNPSVEVGRNTYLQIHPNIKSLVIKENVSWRDNNAIRMNEGATLIMEKNVYLSQYTSINCLEKIIIGENSWIGEGSKLYDHNHAYVTEPEYEWKIRDFETAPIIIGKNVKIYSNVTILKGVTIGDNVIIGSGCTIYKDIPSGSIVINKSENIIKDIFEHKKRKG
ncbi:MAG: acyltransferase [Bergeyella zoohelcum]|nr:acyltransferase [Bergeyella zoohelcum]